MKINELIKLKYDNIQTNYTFESAMTLIPGLKYKK